MFYGGGMNAGMYQQPQLRQRMSQSQQLSVQVLQFTTDELHEWLEKQVDENPLLDWDSRNEVPAWQMQQSGPFRSDWMLQAAKSRVRSFTDDDSAGDWWLRIASSVRPYKDDLLEQLHMISGLTAEQIKLCEMLIEALDEDGYLRVELTELSVKNTVSMKKLEQALLHIQKLEPSGTGARSLEECIAIQWQDQQVDAHWIRLLPELMPLLDPRHHRRLQKFLKEHNQSEEELYRLLKRIHPRPGMVFEVPGISYVIPDVWIEKEEQEWVIRWNPRSIPDVTFHRILTREEHAVMKRAQEDAESAKYIQNRRIHGKRISQFLQLRAHTLQKVIFSVFRKQEAFLNGGPQKIVALEMQQIADELRLHESTISRAVHGKWVATPWGTFPLRMFFHAGIRQRNGKKLSPQEIQSKIRSVIDAHPEPQRCSDETVSKLLQKQGVKVARRTVNKYRQLLGIPCTYARPDKNSR